MDSKLNKAQPNREKGVVRQYIEALPPFPFPSPSVRPPSSSSQQARTCIVNKPSISAFPSDSPLHSSKAHTQATPKTNHDPLQLPQISTLRTTSRSKSQIPIQPSEPSRPFIHSFIHQPSQEAEKNLQAHLAFPSLPPGTGTGAVTGIEFWGIHCPFHFQADMELNGSEKMLNWIGSDWIGSPGMRFAGSNTDLI